METNYKITIPKPCHEDWDKMTPEQTGRFCNSCVKSVVDFTNMKAPEIQEYFRTNQGQKVCGRFKNEQINKFDIQIPQSVLKRQMPFHKAFLLTLFVVMGSTLFSCKNHNDETLGDVNVVSDTISAHSKDSVVGHETLGKIDIRKYDSLVKAGVKMPPLPPPPPVKQANFVKPTKRSSNTGSQKPYLTGDVAFSPTSQIPESPIKKELYTASEVELKPTFPGGLIKFYEYINSNLKVPENNRDITAKIILSFIVNTDGSLSEIKVLRGINDNLDNEILKILKEAPKWTPGEQNGEKVRVSYVIPIKITAQE